jgi:hypothetical protein
VARRDPVPFSSARRGHREVEAVEPFSEPKALMLDEYVPRRLI